MEKNELVKVADLLVKEHVGGTPTPAAIRNAMEVAAYKYLLGEVSASPTLREELLNILRREAAVRAGELVKSQIPLVLRDLAARTIGGIDIGKMVAEEVRKVASHSIGQQVAKRMQQFFTAVDVTFRAGIGKGDVV